MNIEDFRKGNKGNCVICGKATKVTGICKSCNGGW